LRDERCGSDGADSLRCGAGAALGGEAGATRPDRCIGTGALGSE